MGLAWLSGKLGAYWMFQYANYQINETLYGLAKPVKAEHTAIITVDSTDYKNYLGGTSPLNPAKLADAICAVLTQRPAVLVVDFDTSDPSFKQMQIPKTDTRIVWARSIYRFRGITYAGAVLGMTSGSESQGFAVGPADRDGTVRSFPRQIYVDGKSFATVHWRAVQELHAREKGVVPAPWGNADFQESELEVGRLSNNFQFDQYPIREFSPTNETCRQLPKANVTHNFENKIVLFGGNYQFSDIHRSPFEEKWGVELLASAVEAELSGHGVKHLPDLTKFAFKLALATAIGLSFHFLFALPATLISICGLGVVVVFGNLIAVFLGGYEGMVVPFVLGVVIEQLVNVVEQAQHAQSELASFELREQAGLNKSAGDPRANNSCG
jgi:CHASE2 domain-containing sensor protein